MKKLLLLNTMKKLLLILLCVPLIGMGQQTGCISGDCENGYGTYVYYPSGDKYVGEFKNKNRNGQGTMDWNDGYKYVGEWQDGHRHGQGIFTSPSGDKYVGEYKYNEKDGKGTYTYSNGEHYVGEWKGNKLHGQGTMTWNTGDKYVGEYKEDMRNTVKELTLLLMEPSKKDYGKTENL